MRVLLWIFYTLFALLLLYGLGAFLASAETTYDETALPRTARVAQPLLTFDGVGAVTWYRQTDGEEPWLVYVAKDGAIATKSLVCKNVCAAHAPKQFHVVGTPVDEHINVTEITPAAPGDPRIVFVSARLNVSDIVSGVTITPRIVGNEGDAILMWADVKHDGVAEQVFFRQGTLVPIGLRTLTLLFAHGGMYHFAVITP